MQFQYSSNLSKDADIHSSQKENMSLFKYICVKHEAPGDKLREWIFLFYI